MGALILPSRFTQQPQIAAPLDLSDSLGRGLVHSWGLNVRGPNSAHDATWAAFGVFSAGNSWVTGSSGSFINFNDGGAGPAAVAIPVGDSSGSGSPKNSTTWSFACRFRLLTTGNSQCLYGSTSGGIEIRIQPSSQINLLKQQQVDMGTSTGGFAIGEDTDIVVTYNNGNIQFYVKGLPAGSATNSQAFNLATQYYLGSSAFLGNGTDERIGNGGRIYKADVWNRVLSPLEVRSWSDNPWRTHKAPSRRLWVAGDAPAGISASIAWTEAGETMAIAGLMTNRVAVAWSEAGETSALNAVLTNRATASWTESGETTAIASTITNRGALAWTEQGEMMTITATAQEPAQASIQVAMAWTEAGETSAVVARLLNRAAIAQTEQGDAWNLTAYAEIPPIKPTVTVTVRFIALKRDYNMKTINLTD